VTSATKTKSEKKMMPMKDVQVLGAFQPRAKGIDKERAAQIGDAYRRQDPIPPVHIWHIVDEGSNYNGLDVLTGGFHRFEGRGAAGYKDIEAHVFTGTFAEAMRSAAMENIEHDKGGLPRTNKDKARAVLMVCQSYKDLPRTQWPSNRVLAELAKVTHQHVNNMDPFGRAEDLDEGEKYIIKDRSIEKNAARRQAGKKSMVEQYDAKGIDEAYCYLCRATDIYAEQHGVDVKTDKTFKAMFEGLDLYGDGIKKLFKLHKHSPNETAEQYEAKAKAAKEEAAKKPKAEKEPKKEAKEKPAKAKKGPKVKPLTVGQPEPVEPGLPGDDEFNLVDESEK
jgi:hypothetical protein